MPSKKLPLVSVIMPSYNCAEYIEESIKSVKNQTYKNVELIIVDDFSTDATLAVLKKLKITPYKNQFNKGAAGARNTAIKHANGRFIAFLDSDDLWYPTKLAKQISFMLKHSYDLTYTWYDYMTEAGSSVGTFKPQLSKIDYDELLTHCDIGCLTAIYDTKNLGKIYMPDISKRQDFGLWLKILKQIPYAYCLKEPLAKYRLRKNSVSSNKFKAAYYNWKVYRDIEKLSIPKSLYVITKYIIFFLTHKMAYLKHRFGK